MVFAQFLNNVARWIESKRRRSIQRAIAKELRENGLGDEYIKEIVFHCSICGSPNHLFDTGFRRFPMGGGGYQIVRYCIDNKQCEQKSRDTRNVR